MSNPLYERLGGHEGILNLIKPFYADVRQHAVLGPIFHARSPDWSAHWEKIADFWALPTGGESPYRGGLAGAHLSLGLEAEHCQHWLGLWELNDARSLPPPAAGEMNELAHRLASRLFTVARNR